MRIDAHLHVWDPARSPYEWLHAAGGPLDRAIGLDGISAELDAAGIDGVVLVQADDADGDTDLMLEVAAATESVVGVVAYVPLHDPPRAAERLAELRQNSYVVGIRNLMHDRQDPDWLLRDDVDEGLGVLERAGVPFDLVGVLPRHLEHVPIVSEKHPSLDIVLDHLTNPPIGRDDLEPWGDLMRAAAENPRVRAKISGLYPVAPSTMSLDEQIRPVIDFALEVFGPDRLMYGGDWPVSTSYTTYPAMWSAVTSALSHLSTGERDRVLGGTAKAFYSI